MSVKKIEKTDIKELYSKFTARKVVFILGSVAVLVGLVLVAASLGAASLGIGEVFHAIVARIFPLFPGESNQLADAIIWDVRLPRIAMAIVGGAGFAISGATMQGILRNPLVSPFTLGISAGAGFGAALALIVGRGIGGGELLLVANAFLFGLIAAMLVLALARLRGITPVTLILAGIAIMYLFSALTSFLEYTATPEKVHGVVFWLMGSLAPSSWTKFFVVSAIFVACLPLLGKYSWDLNAMSVGDETAIALGTNVRKVRIVCMVLATLISASIVCFNGVIGFICLVSPHITRMIIGGDHRFLLPSSCLVGSILLLGSDTVARVAFRPSELPIGVMTTFIGVPFFIYLLLTRRREYF